MRRPVVAAVVAAALVAGGAAGWAREAHDDAAAAARSRDRVASAVAAGAHDESAAAVLANRSSDLVGRGLASASASPAATASASPTATASARQTPTATPSARASARATPAPVDTCKSTYTGPSFYTSLPTADGSGANGDMPTSAMTELTWAGLDPLGHGYWLRTDAAAALTRLNTAFQAAFGHHLDLDLAYRDLATQRAMLDALGPQVAAQVGTSKHGNGTAIDVPELPCEYGLHTPQRDWLVAHGPQYGWYQLPGEYWHFEFR